MASEDACLSCLWEAAALVTAYPEINVKVLPKTYATGLTCIGAGKMDKAVAALQGCSSQPISMSFEIRNTTPSLDVLALHIVLPPPQFCVCPANMTATSSQGSAESVEKMLKRATTTVINAADQGQPCLLQLASNVQALIAEQHSEVHQSFNQDGRTSTFELDAPLLPKLDDDAPVQATEVACATQNILLLCPDHFRDKSFYCRTISKWASSLNLTGRIIFCSKLILILLEGEEASIKQYLVNHRMKNVDVDARGKKCRERMMSVEVHEPFPLGDKRGFTDFREVSVGTLQEVDSILSAVQLQWKGHLVSK